MGNQPSVVVPVCIFGSGAAVLLCWAAAHHFTAQVPRDTSHLPGAEFSQERYMREVRLRHHDDLAAVMGGKRVLVCYVPSRGNQTRADVAERIMRSIAHSATRTGVMGLALLDLTISGEHSPVAAVFQDALTELSDEGSDSRCDIRFCRPRSCVCVAKVRGIHEVATQDG